VPDRLELKISPQGVDVLLFTGKPINGRLRGKKLHPLNALRRAELERGLLNLIRDPAEGTEMRVGGKSGDELRA
jgi:hypothetical protein